jgi:hypothetical protein
MCRLKEAVVWTALHACPTHFLFPLTRTHLQGSSDLNTMAAIPTLVRGALLLCFLAATSRALSVSDFPFNPRVVPVNYICTYLT